MEPFASADDVAAGWRPLSSDETSVAETLLERASARIRAHVPGVDDRLANQTLDEVLVKDVVTTMVVRAMRNIDGIRDRQSTLGSRSERITYMVEGATGYLHLTGAERSLLAPPRRPARTIRVRPGLW